MRGIVVGKKTNISAKGCIKTHLRGGAVQKHTIGDMDIEVDTDDTNLQRLKGALRQMRLSPTPRELRPRREERGGSVNSKKKYIYF